MPVRQVDAALAICLVILVPALILEIVGKDSVQSLGVDFVKAIQMRTNTAFTDFMKFVSFFGDAEYFIIVPPILFFFLNPFWAWKVSISTFTAVFMFEVLKLWYHRARPYWVDTHVIAFDCRPTYGMPSGHAFRSAFMLTYLLPQLLELFPRMTRDKKAVVWAFGSLLVLLVGFSRVYLGAHFPNQAGMGWCIGIFIALLYLRMDHLFERKMVDMLAAKRRLQTALWFVVTVLVASAVLWGSYLLLEKVYEVPQSWRDNAATQCSIEISNEPILFVSSAGQGAFLGASLAICLIYEPLIHGVLWGHTSWAKTIIRLVVGCVVEAGIYTAMYFLLPLSHTNSLGYNALVVCFVSYFVLVFVLFAFLPMLFAITGLIQRRHNVFEDKEHPVTTRLLDRDPEPSHQLSA